MDWEASMAADRQMPKLSAVGAGRMRFSLGREIAVILTIKAAAILALFFLFFGPGHRPDITSQKVTSHLVAAEFATGDRE
jgi:hypothetical protein